MKDDADWIRQLALIGAQVKLKALLEEVSSIKDTIRELQQVRRVPVDGRRRKKRGWSAARRRAFEAKKKAANE